MIINSANKFVEKLNRWVPYFTVVYWILALIPLGLFGLFILTEGPPRYAIEFFIGFFAVIIYIAATVFLHRLALLVLDFMKALVTTTLECQQELSQIRNQLKKPPAEQEQFDVPARPSPFNFEN